MVDRLMVQAVRVRKGNKDFTLEFLYFCRVNMVVDLLIKICFTEALKHFFSLLFVTKCASE